MFFSYLLLAQTEVNPLTNSKFVFQHSFPRLLSWLHLRQTNRYTYQQGEHMCTPNIGILMVIGFLFLAQTQANPLTQNLCFNIRFHLYIHDHILDKPIGTLTSRVNTLMFFGYLFFLAQTETNPPNKSKSAHSFPRVHPWLPLRQTNWYTYQQGEHNIRESVDSLCRNGANTQYIQYNWNKSLLCLCI